MVRTALFVVGGLATLILGVAAGLLIDTPGGGPTASAQTPGVGTVYVIDVDVPNLPPEVDYDATISTSQIPSVFASAGVGQANALIVSRSHFLASPTYDPMNNPQVNIDNQLKLVIDNHHVLFVLDTTTQEIVEHLYIEEGFAPYGTIDPGLLMSGSLYFDPPVSEPVYWAASFSALDATWEELDAGQWTPGEPMEPPYSAVYADVVQVLAESTNPISAGLPTDFTQEGLCQRLRWFAGRKIAMGRRIGSQFEVWCCPAGAMYDWQWVYIPCEQCIPHSEAPICPSGSICPGAIAHATSARQAADAFADQLIDNRYHWFLVTESETIGSASAFHPWGAEWPGLAPQPLPCTASSPNPTPPPDWSYSCRTEEPNSWLAFFEYATKYHGQSYDASLDDWAPKQGASGSTTFSNSLGRSISFARPGLSVQQQVQFSWSYNVDSLETQVDASRALNSAAWTQRDNNILAACGCSSSDLCDHGWAWPLTGEIRSLQGVENTPGARANRYNPGMYWTTDRMNLLLEHDQEWNWS